MISLDIIFISLPDTTTALDSDESEDTFQDFDDLRDFVKRKWVCLFSIFSICSFFRGYQLAARKLLIFVFVQCVSVSYRCVIEATEF